MITRSEVEKAQQIWGDLIIRLGTLKENRSELEKAAKKGINDIYAYDVGTVLFKPTRAASDQFRLNKEGALSYFIGGNSDFPEDSGFANQPWSDVEFKNIGIILNSEADTAFAMGNYFFIEKGTGNVKKVEYTFGYIKNSDDNLKVNIHHSSVPFSPTMEQ